MSNLVKISVDPDKPKRATREALGATLADLLAQGEPIAAVDADLSASTTLAQFAASSDEAARRFFNAGIAEQDMVGIASGLSLTGLTVFTGSFAVFGTGRCYDQIRNTVCYSKLNVKITPTHAGISVGADGGSHQMLEDIALMRVLPNMRVLVPADYASACNALRIAAATAGPVYVRLGRAKVPQLYEESQQFDLGRAAVLRSGSDVSIFACGIEVNETLAAADLLASHGVSAEVIDLFSIKPLDEATILESVAKTGCAVTVEEHQIAGGADEAVASLLARKHPCPVEMVGVDDRFGTSGEFEELLTNYHLDAASIAQAAEKACARTD